MPAGIRREIGSEFWDIPVVERSSWLDTFPSDVEWFVSGRSALGCILDDALLTHDIKRAAIPSWCCESMIEPFSNRGIQIVFYSVQASRIGGLERTYEAIDQCDLLLEVGYFGFEKTPFTIFEGVVVQDLTHSLFSSLDVLDSRIEHANDDARRPDYCFGSLRKWAGFWTGGYAWKASGCLSRPKQFSKVSLEFSALRRQGMAEKSAYISGLSDEKLYLDSFSRAEEIIDKCTASDAASQRDIMMAKQLDVRWMMVQRYDNAKTLLAELSDFAVWPEITKGVCPLFVPILVPKAVRNGLRRFLAENDIYCPVHWPISAKHHLTNVQLELYDKELSLICDQRYNYDDMIREVQLVKEYLGNEHRCV